MSASQALRWGAGACAASLGLELYVTRGDDGGAHCLAGEQTGGAAAAKREAELAALAEWLRQQGADVDAISIKESGTVRQRSQGCGSDAIVVPYQSFFPLPLDAWAASLPTLQLAHTPDRPLHHSA